MKVTKYISEHESCPVDEWYLNEECEFHREDGPAMIYKDGKILWCLNNALVGKEEVMRRYPQNFKKTQMVNMLI